MSFTDADRIRNRTKCFFCDLPLTKENKTVDHLVPSSRGGKYENGNLVFACATCNQDKGSLTLEEYRAVVAVRRGILPSMKSLLIFAGEGKDDYLAEVWARGRHKPTATWNLGSVARWKVWK